MSKIETKQIRTHVISLSDNEAEFLRDFLQNWPYSEDEPKDIEKMRCELFNILSGATQ